jgi:hypothetical protein
MKPIEESGQYSHQICSGSEQLAHQSLPGFAQADVLEGGWAFALDSAVSGDPGDENDNAVSGDPGDNGDPGGDGGDGDEINSGCMLKLRSHAVIPPDSLSLEALLRARRSALET